MWPFLLSATALLRNWRRLKACQLLLFIGLFGMAFDGRYGWGVDTRDLASETHHYVWWEGETPIETNFPAHSAFSSDTIPETRHLLSGGDWLTNSDLRTGDEAFAKYRVTVPVSGEYALWTRKFWQHGPFRWRFDTQDWQVCGRDIALADTTELRTFLCANWVYLGRVKLTKEEHTFDVRLLAKPGENLTAAFDCFLLTRDVFMPNGKLKPGEYSHLADSGYFAFEPSVDPFDARALLDLRSLNEHVAGESGFVQREGNRFLLGNGKPVRFWAVNVSSRNAGQDRASVDYLARKLAKLGVNMVRYHGPFFTHEGDPTTIDQKRLDDFFYLVAAMKRNGIYTMVSFYFPLWYDVRPQDGLPGYETMENKVPFTLLYFEPRMQEIYHAWAHGIFTTTNPYTGVPLAKEPAVGIIEIINEDSFFFWTFTKSNISAPEWEKLERRYGQWLIARYGSLEQAFTAWQGEQLPEDDSASERVGLYEAWHMTGDGSQAGGPGKVVRVGDQVRFLTELQRSFYADTVQYFRRNLGVRSLLSASNWTTTDAATLDALERYTYTAAEVIDGHGYFGGRHEGEGSSYSVRVGHTYENLAGVTVPEKLPLRFIGIEGHPQIISEIGWTNPNRYRADATFLGSTYGALQGLDGIYWFAVGSNYLRDTSIEKFPVSSPVIAGTFPATALQYRRGDVQEADEVIHQVVKVEDLYAMKGSGITTKAALDAFRQQEVPVGREVKGAVQQFDPLTCYVGRVTREFGNDPADSTQRDITQYISSDHARITSLTGELQWDSRTGLVQVNTPRSQGATGFFAKAGLVTLRDITIDCQNEFASIMVIALDDQPLAQSKRILLQVMTEEQPYSFMSENGRITNLGGAPFGIRQITGRIAIRLVGHAPAKVVALDESGYATNKQVVTEGGNEAPLTITLAPEVIYYIVMR